MIDNETIEGVHNLCWDMKCGFNFVHYVSAHAGRQNN